MANDELLTDDYVAEMLAKEADTALRYSSLGMGDSKTGKKPAHMPKPNTRFLQHIIKDTTTHNAALLKKEAAESKARLQELETEKEKKRLQLANPQDMRQRQIGSIQALLGAGSKRRAGSSKTDGTRLPKTSSRDAESQHRRGSNDPPEQLNGGRRKRLAEKLDDDDLFSKKRRRSHRERDSESEENTASKHRKPRHGYKQRYRGRSDSPQSRRRSRSPEESTTRRHRQRSPVELLPSGPKSAQRQGARASSAAEAGCQDDEMDLDSDDAIGPRPVGAAGGIHIKGRGGKARTSGIDERFSDAYDPSSDVQPAETEEEALEAFRDRQKRKLRAAGWGDGEIQKWSRGELRSEEDVRWRKKGEQREWDRGKVLEDD